MLDPRIYRAAFVPVLLALLVAAFSLEDRPRAFGTTLAPDLFQADRAVQTLDGLARMAPVRRPGDAGDAAVAHAVAQSLRASLQPSRSVVGGSAVTVRRFRGRTIDGTRTLQTVIGRLPGQPGPGIVVVAHRDAVSPGAKAELSGTAALLELARVAGEGRLRRSITFVSTSGGSGGMAGARDIARRLGGPTDAVLVLGDMAGEHVRRPFVVGWSNAQGFAPLRLRRTVEAAVREETGTDPGGPRAGSQWARLAFPMTVGEQGAFARAGLPAVLLSASGERPPAADAPVSVGRMQVFGRAALRAIFALDGAPDLRAGPAKAIVTQRKILPLWAVRLLVGALLLPVLIATIDGFARSRRRRAPVGRSLAWVLASALPYALAAAVCTFVGLVGILSVRPGAPVPAPALEMDGAATATLAVTAVAFLLGWVAVRPLAIRVAGARPMPAEPGPAIATLLVLCVCLVIGWATNVYATALLIPAAHLWLLAVAPEIRMPRGLALACVLVALAPFALVAAGLLSALGISAGHAPWFAALLVAGGHVSALSWLGWSIVAGCATAAAIIAVRRAPPAPPAADVTVRGPLTYAGPGSLGGTESALRR